MTDNRTLDEIQKDHGGEVRHKIRNANALYFTVQKKVDEFWLMCHRKAVGLLGIKPKDMNKAVAEDDGVMCSAVTVKNVRVEVKHFADEEWMLGTYFYKIDRFTKEIDELAYFLSHVKHFDHPIRDAKELQKGKFRVITNVPYEESRAKIYSFPGVGNG